MIRIDEATSGRPESRYSLALYTSTLLLATSTSILGLTVAVGPLPVWANWSVPVIIGMILGFVFAARPVLGDSIRSLSHGEATAWWLLSGALFAMASVIFGGWIPLAGLVALQIPALFTLVLERGYARYYVLCGLTFALAVASARMLPIVSVVIIALFMLLMILTMAYENFFFGLENAPAGAQFTTSAWLPLRAAMVRFTICALATAPLILLTPVPEPSQFDNSSGDTFEPRITGNIDSSFTLLETFIYTMVLVLLLIGLGALLRWMRNRRRRRSDEMLPESIGMPVGEFREIEKPTPPPLPDPRTPIGKVVFWYGRFSEKSEKRGRGRKPSETPEEFRRALLEDQVVPSEAVDTITSRFETARYASGEVTEQEAHEFQLIVQETVSRMSGDKEAEEATADSE